MFLRQIYLLRFCIYGSLALKEMQIDHQTPFGSMYVLFV